MLNETALDIIVALERAVDGVRVPHATAYDVQVAWDGDFEYYQNRDFTKPMSRDEAISAIDAQLNADRRPISPRPF